MTRIIYDVVLPTQSLHITDQLLAIIAIYNLHVIIITEHERDCQVEILTAHPIRVAQRMDGLQQMIEIYFE